MATLIKLINIFFLLLMILSLNHHITKSQTTDFIKAECRTTRYPTLCVQCLSNYTTTIQQSQRQLAHAAISVSLSRAQLTASFVYKLTKMRGVKPREIQAVKDCVVNMGDTVDQLSRSMKELGSMRSRVAGQDFDWHVSNVLTWVSAALTNENTCLDAFARSEMDGNIKVSIRRRVLGCAQLTSNALALVNRFAERHKVDASNYISP